MNSSLSSLCRNLLIVMIALTPVVMWPMDFAALTHYQVFQEPKYFWLGLLGLVSAPLIWISRNKLSITALDIILLALFSWAGLNFLGTDAPWPTFLFFMAQWISAYLILLALRVSRLDSRRLIQIMMALVAVTTLLDLLNALPWTSMPRRPVATIGNRNFVAAFLGILLPFPLWDILKGKSKVVSIDSLLVILSTLAIVSTRCRSVWLGCLIFLPLMIVLSAVFNQTSRKTLVIASIAVIVGVIFATQVPWPGVSWESDQPYQTSLRTLTEYQSGTGQWRLQQYAAGLQMWKDHPWGVGLGGWPQHYLRYATSFSELTVFFGKQPPTPNSDWVRVLAELGWLGLVIFASFWGYVLFKLFRGLRHKTFPVVATLGSLGIFLIHSLFDAPLFRPEIPVLLALILTPLFVDLPGKSIHSLFTWLVPLLAGLGATVLSMSFIAEVHMHGPDNKEWENRTRKAQSFFPLPSREADLVAWLDTRRSLHCRADQHTLDRALVWTPYRPEVLKAGIECAVAQGQDDRAQELRERRLSLDPEKRGF